MLARLRNIPTVAISPIFKRYQPVLGLDLPTEEELATMSTGKRWYYKQMADPVLRRKLSDRSLPNHYRYFAALKRKGAHEGLLERKKANEKAQRADPKIQFARHMSEWLRRTSDVREAFEDA
jgi:hypothetical protein